MISKSVLYSRTCLRLIYVGAVSLACGMWKRRTVSSVFNVQSLKLEDGSGSGSRLKIYYSHFPCLDIPHTLLGREEKGGKCGVTEVKEKKNGEKRRVCKNVKANQPKPKRGP